jgi:hypothetical protein
LAGGHSTRLPSLTAIKVLTRSSKIPVPAPINIDQFLV